MCRHSEALEERQQAAESLSQTCLARLPSPIGEALDRTFNVDPNIPAGDQALLDKLDADPGARKH